MDKNKGLRCTERSNLFLLNEILNENAICFRSIMWKTNLF